MSNGKEHWFWNYQNAHEIDAHRIQQFPSPDDLERLRMKNLHSAQSLCSDSLGSDYLSSYRNNLKLRSYQIRAIATLSQQFDEQQKRKFLLEMATGTGKTLLCAALILRFLKTKNAERVLFIVDRIELATQTMEDFNDILRDYKPVIYKDARKRPSELLGSCVVVATIQSLMTNRRFKNEFSPFYFDLVINDEAHRSIYGDARECVEYFQATKIGLTATPKAYLKNIDIKLLGQDKLKH